MGEQNKMKDDKLTTKSLFIKKGLLIVAALSFLFLAAGSVAYSKASNSPRFCGNCHIIKPYYESWKEGPLLAAKHGAIGNKCLACHHQTIPEKVKEGFGYVTGNYQNPLKERDFSREKCLECHQKNWAKIVKATDFEMSNPHKSHLGDIECHLCHKMHKKSEVFCAQCHEHDWFKKLDDSWSVPTK